MGIDFNVSRALQTMTLLAMLLVLAAGLACTPPRGQQLPDVDEAPLAFDPERAASCLEEARSVMTEHGAMYRELEEFFSSREEFGELRNRATCTKSYSFSVARARGIPPDVFMRFEGGWRPTKLGKRISTKKTSKRGFAS